MGLVDEVVKLRIDKRNEAAAKAAEAKAAEEKAKLDEQSKVVVELLAAGRVELATKRAELSRAESIAKVEEVNERMRIIQADRRARNKRELKPAELRVRALKSLGRE